jgi:hypothetical protein
MEGINQFTNELTKTVNLFLQALNHPASVGVNGGTSSFHDRFIDTHSANTAISPFLGTELKG